ncbi:RsmB/NOP family class I SAM-dependent RNA methyltransferase [Devosia aurantiaca]|uniref:SAM-dependent MTase RsmB/NOP-type domain-containing protein n=1 Tax=Devosia aurantiaca TaxID=2714858 RepID=A0A6M1SHN1_9HYPH|nr:hypothetical protein [Devosia aurantiaca]NGP16698.1 hypothetical protein [Devosia aurantiaca]
MLWHRSANDIAGRVRLQRSLLSNALRSLKPGGTLIYCVCSLEAAEGEDQVQWALDALPELELSPVRADELPGLPGAVSAKGLVRTHPAMRPGESDGEWTASSWRDSRERVKPFLTHCAQNPHCR